MCIFRNTWTETSVPDTFNRLGVSQKIIYLETDFFKLTLAGNSRPHRALYVSNIMKFGLWNNYVIHASISKFHHGVLSKLDAMLYTSKPKRHTRWKGFLRWPQQKQIITRPHTKLTYIYCDSISIFSTLMPRQYGCHFPDDIFKRIFLNEDV